MIASGNHTFIYGAAVVEDLRIIAFVIQTFGRSGWQVQRVH
jgi:hypothetical protein